MPVAGHEPVGELGKVSDDRQSHEPGQERPSTPTLAQHCGNCGRAAGDTSVGSHAVDRLSGSILSDAVRLQISALERLEPHITAPRGPVDAAAAEPAVAVIDADCRHPASVRRGNG